MATTSFDANFCAERLKAIGDPHRLKIISALRYGEMTVTDLAELIEAENMTVSHHLKILKYAKVVEVRREGRFMYYRLHEDLVGADSQKSMFLDLGCCRLEVPDRKA